MITRNCPIYTAVDNEYNKIICVYHKIMQKTLCITKKMPNTGKNLKQIEIMAVKAHY